MFSNINFSGKSREYIADALVHTELDYVCSLEAVDNVRNRLQQLLELGNPVLNKREIDRMFLNLRSILDFHKDLSKELLTLRLEGPQEFLCKLGKTFFQFIPFFKLYAAYIGNYRNASQYVTKKLQVSKNFRIFVELEERCDGTNKSLKTLLGLPMGRLPQYLHILFAIHSRPGDVGSHLAKAILAIQAVSDAISADIKSQVARKMVVTVQDKVFGKTVNLIAPSRHVVKKGELRVTMPSSSPRRFAMKKRTEPKMYLVVLFNDFVLVGSARKPPVTNRKVKVLMRIAGLECEDPEDNSHSFVLRTNLGGVETAMIMYAQNAEQKMKWLSAIDRVLEEYLHSAHEEYLDSISEFEALILKKPQKKNNLLEAKIKNPVPIDQVVIHMQPLGLEFSDPTICETETILEEDEEKEEHFASPWQKVEGQYWINTRTLERAWSIDEKTGQPEYTHPHVESLIDLDMEPAFTLSPHELLSPNTDFPFSSSAPPPLEPPNAPSPPIASSPSNALSPPAALSPPIAPSPSNALSPPTANDFAERRASVSTPMHGSSPPRFSRVATGTRGQMARQSESEFFGTDAPPSPPPSSPPRAPEAPPSSPPRQVVRAPLHRPSSASPSSPNRQALRVNVLNASADSGPPTISLRAASASSSGSSDLLSALRQGATTLKKVTANTPVPENKTFHNAINDSIAAYIQSIRPLIQEDDDVEDGDDWT